MLKNMKDIASSSKFNSKNFNDSKYFKKIIFDISQHSQKIVFAPHTSSKHKQQKKAVEVLHPTSGRNIP